MKYIFLVFVLLGWTDTKASDLCENDGDITYICGVMSAEDLIHIQDTNYVLAGQLGGSDVEAGGFYLIDIRDKSVELSPPDFSGEMESIYNSCPGAPDPKLFAAHGIAIKYGKGTNHRLLVVNHGGRESIEVFNVETSTGRPQLNWRGCVPFPTHIVGNSVQFLEGNGMALTSFGMFNDEQSFPKVMAGEPSGTVIKWQPGKEWETMQGTEFSGNNGLMIMEEGGPMYVASWGTGTLEVVKDGISHSVDMGDWRPDNIRRGPDGSLIIAGQATEGKAIFDCLFQGVAICAVPYRVVKIDPKTFEMETLVDEMGSPKFGGASAAIIVGDEVWVGPFKGDRIAIKKLKD